MTYRFIYIIAALPFFMQCTSKKKQPFASLQWSVAGTLPAMENAGASLGVAGPVAGVHENILLIGGGANFPDDMPWNGGGKKYYDNGYIFSLKKNNFLDYVKAFSLPKAIAYGAACSTTEGIVYAGGENENGLSNEVWLLKWNKDHEDVTISTLPSLPFAVTNASITFYAGSIYLAGGELVSGVSDRMLKLDLNNLSAGWVQLAYLPNPLSHTVMTVQYNGEEQAIYLIGGRQRVPGSKSVLYANNLHYNISSNQWTEKKSLPYPLSAGTGMALGEQEIYLFGGDRGETFHKTEELLAAIAGEENDTLREQLNRQKADLQSTHPGFSRSVLVYNTLADTWTNTDSVPYTVPVTTVATRHNQQVIIPTGEIKAGVRTTQILVGNLLTK